MAHTAGDIYVYFKDSNVLAVGDVASPVKDPELDWITGAWIGGRVDAMDLLLKIGNDQTRFVPGTGPVMTRAEFKAERELMEVVRQRLFKQIRQGDGPQDMVEGGVLKGLAAHLEGSLQVSLCAPRRACGGTTTSWIRMLFRLIDAGGTSEAFHSRDYLCWSLLRPCRLFVAQTQPGKLATR